MKRSGVYKGKLVGLLIILIFDKEIWITPNNLSLDSNNLK